MAKPEEMPAQRVAVLLRQRRALGRYGDPAHGQELVEPDAELMTAIAAWRQRRLTKIDAQLRDLGIDDVPALPSSTRWPRSPNTIVCARWRDRSRDLGE